ncbi:MAG: hypothetical protein IJE25_00360 [Clostridia bacterium]|nr:hypothetical protein [Clostridia bacterium]
MTVRELSRLDNFSEIILPDPDREIIGGYVGDLLSWVMGRAESGNAWITIMSNVNVLAVATLADVSCVIIAEGVVLSEDVISVAKEKEINLISTSLPMFEASVKLSEALR